LADFVDNPAVVRQLMDVAKRDSYKINRAKAVSILADRIDDRIVKESLIERLDDSSIEVRRWAVWALKGSIEDEAVQEALIRHLLYKEQSKIIKSWIINALSSQIHKENVEITFLRLLKTPLSNQTRALVVSSLLTNLEDSDVLYALSRHVSKEPNKEIRKAIIERLKEIDDMEATFALERLAKTEKNAELRKIIGKIQ
ncbi:MAG: HEAT repeat domain-containing protein, partial [Candidatus Heimdallarchaeaceae archaeon]